MICDKCQKLFHLRCLIPPQSSVPKGDWFCPACDPFFSSGEGPRWSELRNADTPFIYQHHDPHLDQQLLDYIHSGHDLGLLESLPARRAADIRRRGSFYQPHPGFPEWLLFTRRFVILLRDGWSALPSSIAGI